MCDKGQKFGFATDSYLRANLLTVEKSWNHRGLSHSRKAALTETRLFTALFTVWCGEITVDVAGGVCSRICRHNRQPAIVSDPLSYLYTTASRASKLIALDCREAPMSKQANSWLAKKCKSRFKSSHTQLATALNASHTDGEGADKEAALSSKVL